MALVVAGERSGVGKTTVTMALLAALTRWGDRVQSFKVGPDYIDPMFHQFITGRACRNLDPLLTSETYVQQCFASASQDAEFALIEGVMGLFDGASGREDVASTAQVARLLNLPVLLVLDCARMSRSVAAIAHGYRSFDLRLHIAGVVLNRVGSDRHLTLLKEALEPLGLPILGVLRRQDEITLPDRHLGLVPTDELPALGKLCDRLASLAETSFDWNQLRPLLKTSQTKTPPWPMPAVDAKIQNPKSKIRLAVARDRAFSFYYADNLELLEQLGAELVFWSPLQDAALPEGVGGLYFGGGFPEMFAAELAANAAARAAVRAAIQSGLTTYAECGGLMYLSQSIVDFDGNAWETAGVLPTAAVMGKQLTLGYRRAIAQQNTFLYRQGETLWGHEFHRSHLTHSSENPLYHLQPYAPQSPAIPEGWQSPTLHASYLHVHWGAQPEVAARFVAACGNRLTD
ncbi:cobyrinate a,c-diamide synthase [Thermoleptolyngbya sp. C42_A2020_037]|uniref:cobyrinate a,c-diamide synthase n=1 Tax=Thermoleptolyngbya sp. C42_A2020_037 TaxID=2747799 RepID=UPI0019DA4705|nr:cobyrinate a,c-diamide synthase [Thermoleptolyngbya sp. C42_A2020_037]MBF2086094.1 cobyrinate a,c-diamide synthase [Thermoleptolyngbya sp. C42_A2020_037]